ncbi:1-acyl-sn-glycerol-3-phosphate acyltransferase [Porphyromonas gingivalis]|uniref:1-acyl-sn-glycerol-3-phosphate acyltransferase n=1 Tax=Porphyromonas gingivalis TaxID=837 RepID=UPI00097CDF0E|nr:1-acyl-sn-glycerol-3-phosphate acyltransferase [Porphyromonas gingivalis]SJM19567.1 glycerol acyltransferase [Porphyromonas gingivalis]
MQEKQHIHIGEIIQWLSGRKLPQPLIRLLERLIHQDEINDILDRYGHLEGVDFMTALVGYFHVDIDWNGVDRLPSDKRCLFVSNHPLGGLDGICLSHLIGSHYDSDVRYIVNDILFHLRPLRKIFVPVNTRGRQKRESIDRLQEALESDLPVISFPAGFCSRLIEGKVQDTSWKKSFVRQAYASKRDIVPLFFDGLNSKRFYRIERLRQLLGLKFNIGMALLPDEMFRSKGRHFRVFAGWPIPWQSLASAPRDTAEQALHIRSLVYDLSPSALKK